MTRDEVIKGLERCIGKISCNGCPLECAEGDCSLVLLSETIALLKAETIVRCDECEYAGFGDCLLTAGAQLEGCLQGKRRQDNDAQVR